MKHFYPCVLENKEPLFLLRALAGSDMRAGNVCHAVAPPGVWYTSPCHPLAEEQDGNKGCQVTAKSQVWRAESRVPSDTWFLGTCSACSTTVRCPMKNTQPPPHLLRSIPHISHPACHVPRLPKAGCHPLLTYPLPHQSLE